MQALAQSSIERPVVWEPLPKTSQEFALDSRCNDTLFTGPRGPGKSDTQLMRFRRRVGIGYGAYWRGIIFDREYKHLDDLIQKSIKWFNRFNDGAVWHPSTSALKWVWPTGEELLFRVISKRDDYNNYHGHEYPFIGWNELTKYPSGELYYMMRSCNRSSFTPEKDSPFDKTGKQILLPPIPLETFATCNSYGAGHGWVKRDFIDVAPYGQVVRKTSRVFNPATQQEEDVTRTQVTIFGSWRENKYLDPVYIATLMEIKDPNLRAAWLDGNWDIVAGGAFDDLWHRPTHVIPRCQVPASFALDRSFDWGSSQPFSVGWWAEASGEEMTLPNGEIFCPAPGSLIRINEWYGTKELGTNEGLKLGATAIAQKIKEIEQSMMADEWILKQPLGGPADNQIRDVKESDEETIEVKMAKKGIRWTRSDKSPGSRRNGFELFRERLTAAITKEGPAIYVMDNCRAFIALTPTLPRDIDNGKPDDVDTEAEDHPWDETRYRVLKSSNRAANKINVKWAN